MSTTAVPVTPLLSGPVTDPTDAQIEPRAWLINATHQYLSRKLPLLFHQVDAVEMQCVETFTPQQVQLFILYDLEVRGGRNGTKVPAGYDRWAGNYNAEGLAEGFAWINSAGVTMGLDRKVVNPEVFEVDMTDCYSSREWGAILGDGARLLSPEEARLYDRMMLLSASRSVAHEERIVKKETAKHARSLEAGEVEDTDAVVKKLKFNKKDRPSDSKAASKADVKKLTEAEFAAKKARKAEKKRARSAKKGDAAKSDAKMDVD
jgi:hypothetical protein